MADTAALAHPAPGPTLAAFKAGLAERKGPILYAAQVAFVSVTTLFFAFLLNYQHTYWGLLTVPLIVQMNSGLTIWRSIARLVGTILGAVFALVMVALFAQNEVSTIGALALWILAVGILARLEIGLDAYAYATAGYTSLVIALATGSNGNLAFDITVARTTETMLPISVAFMISLVIFPQSVEAVLKGGLRDARTRVLRIARDALDARAGVSTEGRQEAVTALGAVYGNLRATRLERSNIVLGLPKVQAAANALNYVFASSERLTILLAEYDDGDLPPDLVSACDALADAIGRVPLSSMDPVDLAEAAAAIDGCLARPEADRPANDRALSPDPAVRRASAAMHAIRHLAERMAAFLRANAAVLDPGAAPAPQRRIAARYPDWLAGAERGARPALLLLVFSILWLSTASPQFQILATILPALTLILPTSAPRSVMAKAGISFGTGYAAAFLPVLALEIVLPLAESFAVFALLIGSYIFTVFYIASRTGQLVLGITGMILLSIGLQPSNTETYEPLILFNIVASFTLLPAAVGAAFTVIFPETQGWLRRHLRRGSTALLRRAAHGRDDHPNQYLAQTLDVLGDYGGELDLDRIEDRALIRRGAVAMPVGLELYDLHEAARGPDFPPALAAPLAGVARAVAAEATEGDTDRTVRLLADEAGAVRDAAARLDTGSAARTQAVRFALSLEFIAAAVRSGRLAPARRPVPTPASGGSDAP